MNVIPAKSVAVLAELSANHEGSLEAALELVRAAAAAGAHAVKLQTWSRHRMVLDRGYVIPRGPWAGRNLASLYDEAHTPWEWHAPLFALAKELGIVGMTTVYDLEALAYLERNHHVPVYKVASFELLDWQLIRSIAATGKPMILSAGMAHELEIDEAVDCARKAGCKDITVLKCTSAYPATAQGANLRTMRDMATRFDVRPGLSDHTRGIGVAAAAAALGAKVIEKHLKLEAGAGLDKDFSVTPTELAHLVRAVEDAAEAPGEVAYGPTLQEGPQLELRRSLYLAKDIAPGDTITAEHLATARPAQGLAPRFYRRLLGRQAIVRARAGTPVTWGLIEPADAIQEAAPSRV